MPRCLLCSPKSLEPLSHFSSSLLPSFRYPCSPGTFVSFLLSLCILLWFTFCFSSDWVGLFDVCQWLPVYLLFRGMGKSYFSQNCIIKEPQPNHTKDYFVFQLWCWKQIPHPGKGRTFLARVFVSTRHATVTFIWNDYENLRKLRYHVAT